MSSSVWNVFRACGCCGVETGRACVRADGSSAISPCPGRQARPGADQAVVVRFRRQTRRRAVLAGLLPASSGPAVAVVSELLEAAEADGRNRSTFTSTKGQ